mmetsp:Transcript_47513/g.75134  ORF Transcript_47513/g.75134 Transcript_47513/m.75134 type:complete len:240 (+) Transcript_47513:169-888(+)
MAVLDHLCLHIRQIFHSHPHGPAHYCHKSRLSSCRHSHLCFCHPLNHSYPLSRCHRFVIPNHHGQKMNYHYGRSYLVQRTDNHDLLQTHHDRGHQSLRILLHNYHPRLWNRHSLCPCRHLAYHKAENGFLGRSRRLRDCPPKPHFSNRHRSCRHLCLCNLCPKTMSLWNPYSTNPAFDHYRLRRTHWVFLPPPRLVATYRLEAQALQFWDPLLVASRARSPHLMRVSPIKRDSISYALP